MPGDSTRLERQKLYEEVWLTSMVKLAKKYGLSDRGLAKICARLSVPVPPRGYWARKAAGQVVTREPLPPLKEGQRNYIVYNTVDLQPVDPKKQELKDFEKRPENHISVASADAELHPLAAKVREGLESAKVDKWGVLESDAEWCTAVSVSQGTKEPALRIMDALFRAFDARGYTAPFVKEKKRACLEIKGGQTAFVLEEVLSRKERELTKTQQKEKARDPWMYRYPEYIRVPSGTLCLKIPELRWGGGRHSWCDGKRQRIEYCLNNFVAANIEFKTLRIVRFSHMDSDLWEYFLDSESTNDRIFFA